MKRKFYFVVSAFISCALTLSACSTKAPVKESEAVVSHTNKDTSKLEMLSSDIDKLASSLYLNGSILVAKDGQIVLSKAYGIANVEEQTPNTTDTKFLIGSITKQFTAMCIMQLQEKGLLSVEDRLDKYIPSFPHSKEITLHQLLSHTSGLPRDIFVDDLVSQYNIKTEPKDLEEAVNMFNGKEMNLLFPPSENWSYSNVAYIILGYIVEKVSGETYENYLNEKIFTPLKMSNTGFGYNRKKKPKLALGYASGMSSSVTPEEFYDFSIVPFSAGAIYSTTEDLYKWDQALYTEKLVKKETLEKIYTSVMNSYGYGWLINTSDNHMIYSHGGSIAGFRSNLIRQVDKNLFIVILSNENNSTADILSEQIRYTFFND